MWLWLLLWVQAKAAPLDEFRFARGSGQAVSISELAAPVKGQRLPLLLVIWCSYCKSCRQTEPEMDGLARRYAGKLRVVAVDAHPADTLRSISDHRAAKKLKFEVVQDSGGAFCNSLNINFTTTSLLFDQKGQLVYFGAFFGHSGVPHTGATTALQQLLTGKNIRTSNTPQRG